MTGKRGNPTLVAEPMNMIKNCSIKIFKTF